MTSTAKQTARNRCPPPVLKGRRRFGTAILSEYHAETHRPKPVLVVFGAVVIYRVSIVQSEKMHRSLSECVQCDVEIVLAFMVEPHPQELAECREISSIPEHSEMIPKQAEFFIAIWIVF